MKVFAAIALLLATPAWGSDLFQAIDAGDLGQVAQMIEDHPELLNDKNGESMTPLNQAALKGRVEIIRHASATARTASPFTLPLSVATSP